VQNIEAESWDGDVVLELFFVLLFTEMLYFLTRKTIKTKLTEQKLANPVPISLANNKNEKYQVPAGFIKTNSIQKRTS
jgi:hypothetical protein